MHKYNKIFCLLLMPALSLTAMAQETEEKDNRQRKYPERHPYSARR